MLHFTEKASESVDFPPVSDMYISKTWKIICNGNHVKLNMPDISLETSDDFVMLPEEHQSFNVVGDITKCVRS